MRILVTGGLGRVGRYVVKDLVDAGHEVTNFDLPPLSMALKGKGIPYWSGSTVNVEDVYGVITAAKPEAVVHLAAWADAGIVADTRTFSDNISAVYNVLHVCASQGVKKVIVASSIQVYGFEKHAPDYVPVDEDHPVRPVNAYSMAKVAAEHVAQHFSHMYAMSILSFRIMGARSPGEIPAEIEEEIRTPEKKPSIFWTRVDSRDVAQACRKALEAKNVPTGAYNITGTEIVLADKSAALVRRFFPKTVVRPGLEARQSPLSCEKAKKVFGYQPKYPWSVSRQFPESTS